MLVFYWISEHVDYNTEIEKSAVMIISVCSFKLSNVSSGVRGKDKVGIF